MLVGCATVSDMAATLAAGVAECTGTVTCDVGRVEDPIGYLYNDNKAIVSQREIGIDVPNFEEALTYLMRQDPDVVFVGEMRDARTVTAGMRAAETGHLVMGTMHSTNASQAVHRLLDLFPQEERELIRQALAPVSYTHLLLPTIHPVLASAVAVA